MDEVRDAYNDRNAFASASKARDALASELADVFDFLTEHRDSMEDIDLQDAVRRS